MITEQALEATHTWRSIYDSACCAQQKVVVANRAALALGISRRSLMCRWSRLGLTQRPGYVLDIVQAEIAADLFTSDLAIAKKHKLHERVVCRSRARLGIPTALERRRAALRKEVAEYLELYPDITGTDLHAGIVADGWGCAISREHVRAVMKSIKQEAHDERTAS